MIILKVTKKQGFTLSLEDTIFKKPQGVVKLTLQNFSRSQQKNVLGLHYKESNSFSFVYATKMYQFKAKKSETKPYPLCLRNILEHCLANSMKKQY